MSEEPTPGVLLRGEDGSHYFIPKADLAGYAAKNVPEALKAADVAANVPRLHAFSVQQRAGGSDAAQTPMPEGGSETAAFTPMPEGGSEAAAVTPMPEGGPPGPEQS
ncbi:MAG TPA: hypothetical protein VHR46_08175 [Gaiella sp.]|jgi:hypothetical protein|nr:hypothetical protein [Gaiella sp.]